MRAIDADAFKKYIDAQRQIVAKFQKDEDKKGTAMAEEIEEG